MPRYTMVSNSSPLIRFYRGECPDHAGRTLAEILAWPDVRLETVHDYIQWLFPLAVPSEFNPHAPILTANDVAVFRQDGPCRDNFLRAYTRLLRFYGLECDATDPDDVYVDPALIFEVRSRVWLNTDNHNYLRITRILRSSQLLGCSAYAKGLFDCLNRLYREAGGRIGVETYSHWRKAMGL